MRKWINLCEEDDEPADWREALAYYADTPEDVARILGAEDADKLELPGYYRIEDYIIEWDGTTSYTTVERIHDWLATVDVEQFYPNHQDRWNVNFWRHPAALYHATTEANAENILRDGLRPGNQTRGISNRSVGSAIFTTSEFEETVMGSYGTVVFEIDTQRLAKSPQRPYAGREPDVEEYDLRDALARRLGIEDYEPEIEGGMSNDTVILYGAIPPQYLTRLD